MVQTTAIGAEGGFADRRRGQTNGKASSPAYQAYQILHLGFVVAPLIAGLVLFGVIGGRVVPVIARGGAGEVAHFPPAVAAGAAAITFALVPDSFDMEIRGGGLTRAPGELFALLAVGQIYRLSRDEPGMYVGMQVDVFLNGTKEELSSASR